MVIYLTTSPFEAGGIDWMTATDDGSYKHYAEPRHATDAITQDAIAVMQRHSYSQRTGWLLTLTSVLASFIQVMSFLGNGTESPLFLYVAYNAPHSPLLPHPRHEPQCKHIPHLWRREYCGLVIGLGKAHSAVKPNL